MNRCWIHFFEPGQPNITRMFNLYQPTINVQLKQTTCKLWVTEECRRMESEKIERKTDGDGECRAISIVGIDYKKEIVCF